MAVVIETTIGDITVDLYLKERPNTCLNFLKLCKVKYYNLCLFHKIETNFIAQSGDPTGTGRGGESVFCQLYGDQAKYFDSEFKPRLKHEKLGTLSMVNNGNNMNGSQFFLTLGENLTYLDEVHTVFGEVVEGFDVLLKLNETICDGNNRPYQDVRITHTVVLHDPFDDPKGLEIPDASPEPTKEQLETDYIGVDEEIDDTKGKSAEEIEEKIKESEAKARATILEMVGDIPDVEVKPPENVLFVCKLNPVTTSEDLEVIFSRFGPITSCEVIKDSKTGESLQYAFIEFEKEEDCESAYFKMDNVLIDDRRIHVDFSQSVSKMNWDKDKTLPKNKSSKFQNVVLKNNTKGADKYELIFDMDDNRVEHVNDKKHHKHKSNTPEIRHSRSEKHGINDREYNERYKSKSLVSHRKQDSEQFGRHLKDKQSYTYRSRSPDSKHSERYQIADKTTKKTYDFESMSDRKHAKVDKHAKDKMRHRSRSKSLENKHSRSNSYQIANRKNKDIYISESPEFDRKHASDKFKKRAEDKYHRYRSRSPESKSHSDRYRHSDHRSEKIHYTSSSDEERTNKHSEFVQNKKHKRRSRTPEHSQKSSDSKKHKYIDSKNKERYSSSSPDSKKYGRKKKTEQSPTYDHLYEDPKSKSHKSKKHKKYS